MFALALGALFATATHVEITTIGDVSPALQQTIEKELEQAIAELTVSPEELDPLSVTLMAGVSNIHCIATRNQTGATIELDLNLGRLTFRPGIDELVLRLFPERVKKAQARPAPALVQREPSFDYKPLIALGASAALLASGIAFGNSASSQVDRLEQDPMSSMEYRAGLDRAETRSVAANVLFVSAAAGAVITAALFLQ